MTDGNVALFAQAVRQLGVAMRTIAFYPVQHPAVVGALSRAGESFDQALATRDPLALGIVEAGFLAGDETVAEGDRGLAGFAAYLRRRGIAAIVVRRPLAQDDLKAFLEIMALDAAKLDARGGPARCLRDRQVAAIEIVELDAAAAFGSARTSTATPAKGNEPPSRNDPLAMFLIGGGRALPPEASRRLAAMAADAGAVAGLVDALHAACTASTPAAERGTVLVAALRRAAAEVAAADPASLAALARNLAVAVMRLGPVERAAVLGSRIPVPGTDVDLAAEIRAGIPAASIGDVIVSLVQTEGMFNARLGSVIRKVLVDRDLDEAGRAAALAAVQAARDASAQPPADVWASVEGLLQESQDDWISKEYKGLLEILGETPPLYDEEVRSALLALPEIAPAMTAPGTRRHAWLMFADLLELESEPTRRWVALDQIGRRASDMTPEWLADCADVVHAVRGLAFGPPPLVQHVVEAARKALEAIASGLVACYRREFHALTDAHREAIAFALQALGRDGVESLVRGLEKEEDWEIRKTFLVFLTARGREAVPALLRRLGDPSWYLVRNALVILGDIGDPATVPAIGGSLEHADARVKRDAVVALGKIGGARAVALLQERLDDEDVAEVAARALAALDRPGTVGALLRKTAAVDLFGRGHRRITEAIAALAALGADESVPRLHGILKRRLWLPPSAGDDVRIAAARALRRIGTSDALQAVSDGTRLWRRPVREACLDLASDPAEAGRD